MGDIFKGRGLLQEKVVGEGEAHFSSRGDPRLTFSFEEKAELSGLSLSVSS